MDSIADRIGLKRRGWGLVVAFLACALGGASGAAAQATRPSAAVPTQSAWDRTVESLATALRDGDAARVVPLLSDGVGMFTFDGKRADPIRLMARASRGATVFARAYVHAPAELASEIASAAGTNLAVPEDFKRQLALGDDASARRANAIAAQWVGDALKAKEGDLVGVIVVWTLPPPTGAAGEAESGSDDAKAGPVFVLVRGEASGDQAKIAAVVFGDPRGHGR